MQLFVSTILTMTLLMQGKPPAKPAAKPAAPQEDLGTYNSKESLAAMAVTQAYYDKITTFQADFSQVFTKRFHGDQPAESGKIYVKKPGFMTWDYLKPEKKLFLIDGKKAWMYEPSSKQAMWHDIKDSGLPTPVKFLWGKGKLVDDFHVKIIDKSKFAGKGQKAIKLLPKKSSPHFTSVLFIVNEQGAVVSSIVFDSEGNRNRITFSNIVLNKPIADRIFTFTPPKGVQVLQAGDSKPSGK